jgi:cell division septum initiation protein DivIVA
MSENTKKTQITIDDVEYAYEDLTQEQQKLFSHCVDLDRKINSTTFQLDQLNVGKNAFFTMLKQSLETKPEVTN